MSVFNCSNSCRIVVTDTSCGSVARRPLRVTRRRSGIWRRSMHGDTARTMAVGDDTSPRGSARGDLSWEEEILPSRRKPWAWVRSPRRAGASGPPNLNFPSPEVGAGQSTSSRRVRTLQEVRSTRVFSVLRVTALALRFRLGKRYLQRHTEQSASEEPR